MTMFKRYQQDEEKSTLADHKPLRPRPYLKEPNPLIDPPPRIEESLGEEAAWDKPVKTISNDEPETTLGEGVSFKGELSFQRLLRIDGRFEGTLTSTGKLVVGPKGFLKSDDLHLREAIIEGVIEGNIKVDERIELRGDAVVRGDIEAKSLSVDEGVSIVGHIKVMPSSEA